MANLELCENIARMMLKEALGTRIQRKRIYDLQ